MGKGNKSVSHVHPIIKHMNKLGGNPEIKYDPISHDERGMGRGGHLGKSPLNLDDPKKKTKEEILKDPGDCGSGMRRKKDPRTGEWGPCMSAK
jgi:hypothetical protein